MLAHWIPDRRRPQSAATAQVQVDNAQRLAAALEAFYPDRDWRAVIKYHMMCHHVHIVGPAAGEWQRINTEAYELANREAKSVAAGRTNRKEIDRQIIHRSREAMAADHARWALLIESRSSGAARVESLQEKREAARNDGHPLGFEDTNALQFPIHELLERKFPAVHSRAHSSIMCPIMCEPALCHIMMFSMGADYQDPAIVKTLHSPQDSRLSISKCYEPQANQFSSMAAYNLAVTAHSDLKRTCQPIAKFPGRLAVALCKLLEPGNAELAQIEAARAHSPTGVDNVPQSFIDHFVTFSSVQQFKELKFAIRDNPGALRVRTHEQFHGKKPATAVVVRSPHGRSQADLAPLPLQ